MRSLGCTSGWIKLGGSCYDIFLTPFYGNIAPINHPAIKVSLALSKSQILPSSPRRSCFCIYWQKAPSKEDLSLLPQPPDYSHNQQRCLSPFSNITSCLWQHTPHGVYLEPRLSLPCQPNTLLLYHEPMVSLHHSRDIGINVRNILIKSKLSQNSMGIILC